MKFCIIDKKLYNINNTEKKVIAIKSVVITVRHLGLKIFIECLFGA